MKRPPRGGRGGGRPGDGTTERKDGEASEDDEDEKDGTSNTTARARDDEKKDEEIDDSSDYTSNTSSDDDTPIDAAVYSFVPPHSNHNHSATSAQHTTKPAPGTNKPVLPPSLREQSLLVVKQRSTQQRDELDELLHMDEGRSVGGGGGVGVETAASVTGGREQKVKGSDLRNLEEELDDLLTL